MKNQLIIMVGLPGSGKTTYATKCCEMFPERWVRFEADMYFEEGGQYKFDPKKLGEAHDWCYQQVEQALIDGKNVFVSNTNLTKWERAKYIRLASEVQNVEVKIVICTGNYQNVHGVPEEKLKLMKERYEAPSADEFDNFNEKYVITNSKGTQHV